MIDYDNLIGKIEEDIAEKGFFFVDDVILSSYIEQDKNISVFADALNGGRINIDGVTYQIRKESYLDESGKVKRVWFIYDDKKCTLLKITSLIDFLKEAMKEEEGHNKYFRGQKAHYDLIPSLFRNKEWVRKEMELNAMVYNDRPNDFLDCHSTFDKLVRLKHYDQPSRLFDVSSNPLVALFFACYSNKEEADSVGVVVEAFCDKNKEKISVSSDTVTLLTAMTNTKLTIREKDDPEVSCHKMGVHNLHLRAAASDCCIKECIKYGKNWDVKKDKRKTKLKQAWEKEYIGELEHQCKKEGRLAIYWDDLCFNELDQCVLVEPPLNTDRIVRQSGAFIVCGMNLGDIYKPPKSLFNFFKKNDGSRTVYYILPGTKQDMMSDLKKLGINEYFIFPELEKEINVVKSLEK